MWWYGTRVAPNQLAIGCFLFTKEGASSFQFELILSRDPQDHSSIVKENELLLYGKTQSRIKDNQGSGSAG